MLFFMVQRDIVPDKVARGIAELFARLYEQFLPKVFRYISYRVVDTQLAEDLTSVVFEKALTKFRSYDAAKASFSTWIFSIARNTLIDHYRVNSKQQTVQLDNLPKVCDGGSPPEDTVILAEERRRLQSCIAQLPRSEQEIISLKFGAGMTNRQIASLLGLSESNVGVIVYRVVRKLRDNFEEWKNE